MEETPKQETLTVIPIATLMIVMELLAELKASEPEFFSRIATRLMDLKNNEIGKSNPDSAKLVELAVLEVQGQK